MKILTTVALFVALSTYGGLPPADEQKQIENEDSELSKVCTSYVQLKTLEVELPKLPKEQQAEMKKRIKEFSRDYSQARRRYVQVHSRSFVPKECEKLHE